MAAEMPTQAQIAACRWMTEADLEVYATEYRRTGFQGGLNPYRILTEPRYDGELKAFGDRMIAVPALFIGGAEDWGIAAGSGGIRGDAARRLQPSSRDSSGRGVRSFGAGGAAG
jgi:hypothetical protein